MDVVATGRYVRLSPSKVRDMARRLRGLRVLDALNITKFSERKAALHIGKVLKSAIANAKNNAKLAVDDLRIKEASIGAGPRWKRYWSRARGGVSPIRKRTCHIRIVLTDGKVEETASADD